MRNCNCKQDCLNGRLTTFNLLEDLSLNITQLIYRILTIDMKLKSERMANKTILFLDNDSSLLELAHFIFQEYNYQIKPEQSSADIISKVSITMPDVILIDSHISGVQAIMTINILKHHSQFCKIPVILMGTDLDISKLALATKADDFIAKPFDLNEFEQKIFKYMN